MNQPKETTLIMDNDVLRHIAMTYRTLAKDYVGEDRDAWESIADDIEGWLNGEFYFAG